MAKDKDEYVYLRTAGDVEHIELFITPDDAAVEFVTPGTVWTERSYPRPKGPKVVSRIPSSSATGQFDSDAAVWDSFDLLVAIDTSYTPYQLPIDAVTGVVLANRVFLGGSDRELEPIEMIRSFPAVAFRNPTLPAEKYGWDFVIQQLVNADTQRRYPRIGLVVDAYLSEIPDLNSRVKALHPGFPLPDGFQLIYASADSSQDRFVNQIIRHADRVAKSVLTKAKEHAIFENLRPVGGHPSDGIVQIHGQGTIRYEEA